jgi:predicted Fe-Mo cluster-binding NifX family protein
MKTTVAIPVWDDQVSTTVDFARRLLVVEAEGERELSRKAVPLKEDPVERKARTIRDSGTQILLCGAISEPLARAVTQAGIQLVPYVAGPVDDVLGAFLCGRLDDPRFLLPGTRPAARRRWRRGRSPVRAAGEAR